MGESVQIVASYTFEIFANGRSKIVKMELYVLCSMPTDLVYKVSIKNVFMFLALYPKSF